MNVSDSVADLLTRIRNALKADQEEVLIPSSRLNREIARLLKQEGYILDFSVERMARQAGSRPSRAEFETIRVKLKYTEDRDSVISGLKRVSKPGRRQYATADELPKVQGGMGTVIITTSSGVMTGNEARRAGVGGEVVAYVW
jgi:small subunit ribosomal protein S8